MKRTLFLALTGALLSPGLLHAGCTIGGGKNPIPSPEPPPESTTTVELPIFAGSNPGNTVRLASTGPDVPPGASTSIERIASNSRSDRVVTTDPTPPNPPPTGGGGNRCDSIRTSSVAGGGTSYIERTAVATGLARHLIELDLTYYQGNSNPVSGERSWWPVASWILPTGAPFWGSSLRVDYSGWQTGYTWSNPGSMFYVYLDDVLVGAANSETNKPTIELTWSTDGEVSVILDTGPTPGSMRVEMPLELENPITENFQPSHFQVGRVYLPYWLRPSLGTVYAYSHLMEGTPTGEP
jgi:hypothetical protein